MLKRKFRRLRRRATWLAAVAVAVVAIGGWWSAELPGVWSSTNPNSVPATAAPEAGQITALLERVSVVDVLRDVAGGERGCKRGQACSFGAAWNDPNDHSGCDTRNRMLKAQLTSVVIKPGTQGCKVLSGTLSDPYTGEVVQFSTADPMAVQLDHVFAVGRAWDAGAWKWDQQQRVAFANDPANLIAVSGDINRDKSDSGLEWLPPNQGYRCAYVARYLTVAAAYNLAITEFDRHIALSQCPGPTPGLPQ